MPALYSQKKRSAKKEEREWTELPSLVLEKIYSFLNRSDQFNVSLVCRNWLEVYDSPSLWKTYVFDYTESSNESCNCVRYGWKYSRWFKHVKIFYSTPPNTYTWCKQLVAFLHHISSNSQLTSVSFDRFVPCFDNIRYSTRTVVNKAIGDFLKSQNNLKKLKFDIFFEKFADCVVLLNQLNEYSKDKIQHLELRGLSFCDPLEAKDLDSDPTQNLLTFAGLQNLTALEIEYSLIFEKTFFGIGNSQNCPRLSPSTIIIYYDYQIKDKNLANYEGLKSIDWKNLYQLYPHLQVKSVILTDSLSRREVKTLIAPEIPISLLNFTYLNSHGNSVNRSSTLNINQLLSHLLATKTCVRLVSLHLYWNRKIPDLAKAFTPILQACKKLKSLELVIMSPINGLYFLLEFVLEKNHGSLMEVSIFIVGIEEKAYQAILKKLATDYSFRLDTIGLKVKIYPLPELVTIGQELRFKTD